MRATIRLALPPLLAAHGGEKPVAAPPLPAGAPAAGLELSSRKVGGLSCVDCHSTTAELIDGGH